MLPVSVLYFILPLKDMVGGSGTVPFQMSVIAFTRVGVFISPITSQIVSEQRPLKALKKKHMHFVSGKEK